MTRLSVVVVAVASALAGCSLPCALDADCPADMHCGEAAVCTQECAGPADCGISELCRRGRCELDARPIVTWLSPAEGAEVGERFDVEVEVRFRADELLVELGRDPTNPGEPCAPFVPQRVRLNGDFRREAVEVVTFRDVPALGDAFGLQVRASIPAVDPFTRRRAFRGDADPSLGGMTVVEPREGFVDADAHVTLALEAALERVAPAVSAWVEPLSGAPTPRRVLAQDADALVGRVPLARGEQVVWLEAAYASGTRRCGVGIATERTVHDGVEVALAFDAPEPANLDLWVYADLDEEGQSRCALEPPAGVCALAWTEPGLREHGEEAVVLPQAEGIYGIAVAPTAVTAPVSTLVRVSNRNAHLGFFGPRSVLADQAEVWLAGRVIVLGGTVTLEPLDQVSVGLPSEPASAW